MSNFGGKGGEVQGKVRNVPLNYWELERGRGHNEEEKYTHV